VADDLIQNETAALTADAPAPHATEPPRRTVPRATLYGVRFGIAYAVLAVLLGASIGLAVVLAGRGSDAPVAWSDWKPTADGFTPKAKEIADHVGRQYRLPSGRQIVAVNAGQLAVTAENVPVSTIFVRTGPNEDVVVNRENASNSVMFVLCGLGQRCSIDEGEASTARHRLLRREALELSLYAFKYLKVDTVVTFMPPRPDATQETPPAVVYFRSGDLRQALGQPLDRTLSPLPSLTPASFPQEETALVDRLTESRLFNSSFQQAQNGEAAMILDPAV
jgi:hypothetical protein